MSMACAQRRGVPQLKVVGIFQETLVTLYSQRRHRDSADHRRGQAAEPHLGPAAVGVPEAQDAGVVAVEAVASGDSQRPCTVGLEVDARRKELLQCSGGPSSCPQGCGALRRRCGGETDKRGHCAPPGEPLTV